MLDPSAVGSASLPRVIHAEFCYPIDVAAVALICGMFLLKETHGTLIWAEAGGGGRGAGPEGRLRDWLDDCRIGVDARRREPEPGATHDLGQWRRV
jgi:hypothetical protein